MTRFLQWLRVALMLDAPSKVKRIRVVEDNGEFVVEMHPSAVPFHERPLYSRYWLRLLPDGTWSDRWWEGDHQDRPARFGLLIDAQDAAYRATGRALAENAPKKVWAEFDV